MVLSEPADQTRSNMAAAPAVLAAIAATDAICGLRLGRYSRSKDHDTAAALPDIVDLPDSTLPAKLRRVLASKDNVHYSPDSSPRRTLGHSCDKPASGGPLLGRFEMSFRTGPTHPSS